MLEILDEERREIITIPVVETKVLKSLHGFRDRHFVPLIAVWHHSFSPRMSNSDPSDREYHVHVHMKFIRHNPKRVGMARLYQAIPCFLV